MVTPRIPKSRTTRAVKRLLRVTLAILSTELLSTCAEAPTEVSHPGFGMVAVSPIFPSQLAAGITLDRVRLAIVRPPETTLLDRTYNFPATERQLTLSESVLLQARSEQLEITLTFLSGATPLFTGSVTTVVNQGPAGPPVEISLDYVGPGTNVASLTLEPRDTVLTFGASLPFRVTAEDSEGLDVPDFYVSWTSSDPSRTPDGAGVLQAGTTRTVIRITAATPTGARDSTTVRVVPPPARITKAAGDAQTGLVGTRLPVVLEVEVLGADDLPVPGARVAFAAPAGGAVDSAIATTDAAGRARTGATLGPSPGTQDFTASVAGAGSVSFSATATQVAAPSLSFSTAAQTVSEGVGTATITAQLSSPSTQAVTVPFTVGGTATTPADYTLSTSPISIPAGSTTGTITVTVVADAVAEPDETVIVTLGAPTNATLGATTVHTLTITGQMPTVSFTAATQTVSEAVGTATITAQLSSTSSQAVTVPFTVGGTATSPDDYTITASPLTIPAGSTTGTIAVTVVADAVAEPNETVVVTMGTPTNAAPGATTGHTLTIAAQVPAVSFTAVSQTVSEGVGTATITAQLSSSSTQAVTVPFTVGGTATSPDDYAISASPITFPAGSTTGTITVTVVADGVAEPDESVIVTLGTPTNATLGATTVHSMNIAGFEPAVSFTAAAQTVGEGAGTATITAQLSSPSTLPVTVPFTVAGTATSGSDYTISASPLTIPAGSTTGTVTVTVVADAVAEPDETVIVTLGTPTNAGLGTPTVHTLTIAAQAPAVSFTAAAQSVSEGVGTATITAQLSSPSTQAVTLPFTVGGTATSPADFTISATPITIPAGSTTGTITVTVVADGVAEPSETVVVTLGTPTNATLGTPTVHTLTIAAQVPAVSFSTAAQTVSEGALATITAQLSSPSTQAVTVPFTVGGTAINPDDYNLSSSVLTIPAGSTTGTVTVTVAADGVAEPDESVIVTLGTPTNATLGAPTVHTVTIAGQVPTVNLTLAAQTVSEGVGTATITAQLSEPSTQPVTVPFTAGGTATDPADYTISGSPITIPAGSTTGTVTVTVAADAVAEPDETVIVTLGTPTNATLGAPTVHTLTIAAQLPAVSFTAASQTVGEGTVATITAQLSSSSTQAVTVPFTVSGTATDPDDYTISPSPITIPAGSTTGTVTVTVVADGIAEPTETVVITMEAPTSATLGATAVHTVNIAGVLPAVSFSAAAQTVGEGVGTATITAQLSSPSSQPVTVPITVGGTATDPADYAISAGSITIPAGNTTGSVTVTVVADGVAEPDETVVVTLGTPTNAVLGSPTVHTLTIAAQVPTVSFSAAAQSANEGAAATITAQLSSPSSQAVTLPFTLTGTATGGTDYTVTTSPLTIPAGNTSGAITVTVAADGVAELDETVIVTLGTPTNASLGATTMHTVTIPAQAPPVVSFTTAAQAAGEEAVATITAQLSGPSSQTVTLPFTLSGTAASGADYTISTSPITIPAGSTTGTVTVTVAADGVAELDETVIVTLGTPTNATLGATTVHTVTIPAQAPPVVSFTSAAQAVGEGTVATITAQLSGPSSQAVTVPFTVGGTATSPADYTINASPITIPAGSTTGTATVTVAVDGVVEPDETVIVTLGTPTNATLGAITVHTVTIDAQPAPTVSFTAATQTVGEGVGTATITAQLSSPSSQAVTVPFTVGGTATSGTDYSITGSPITIPAGNTTGTVTVTVVPDGVVELDETVIVTLGTPTNATLGAITAHTLTISAQPLPIVSFSAATQSVSEGVGTATITAQLSGPSTQSVTVPFTLSGSASTPADYTISASPITIPAGSTTGTVTVTVVADGVAEPDETVIVTLGTPTNATLGTPTVHTLTLTGQVPVVSFTAATQTSSEGTLATITAQLSSPSTQVVTVPFTVGGTAINPDDYTLSASVLTIPAGSTTGTVTVAVAADGLAEPDETVIVTLGTPTNATLGAPTVHTLTIAAQVPVVNFTAAAQTMSEGTAATITAQLSEPSTQAVTLPFTLSGTAGSGADYTITTSPITISAGNTSGTITVTLVADGVAEPNETVVVTLGTPTNATLGAPTVHTLTIAAQVPVVNFTAATQTVSEGTAATITAQLSEPSTQAVTLPFTVGGTATSPADYTISASPITIPAGATTGTVTVTVVADGLAEPDETVIVTLGTPTNATLGATTVHTGTISGQTPAVSFTAVTQTGSEGTAATITAQLTSPSTQIVTLPFTLSGTATSGSDFTITTSPITIPAGNTSGTITVTLAADGVAEANETVIVTLGTPTNATLGAPTVHTLTIAAQTPTVSFTAASQTGSEGTAATITAQLSEPSTQAVTLPFTLGGTATSGADYTITTSPITIAAGNTSGTITVTLAADGVAEPNETVVVTLGTPTNATLGAITVHTLTIAAQTPVVSFTAASQTGSEGTVATITAQFTQPSTQTVTLPFTVGGTATSGVDYNITGSLITIPAGNITGSISVTLVADGVAEPNETVVVTLGTPTNATLGAPTVHTLTIAAQTPAVSFTAASQTGSEGAVATITAQLSEPSTQTVTLPFTVGGTATSGSDYSITTSPITIPAGSTSGTITVTQVADGVAEPNETVVVTLGTPTNATLGTPAAHTLTILAQVPAVNFTAATQTGSEGTVATITAQLTQPSTQTVTLPFTLGGTASSGSDYTITPSPVTILAGNTTGSISVTLVADGVAEPNETVVVSLGTPTNATLGTPAVHTLTIAAQVPAVNFTAATQTGSEGTVATITAQLTQPSTQTVTLPFTLSGTASSGSDYTITASPVTIPAGNTTGSISVTLVADGVAEPNETVIVTLGTPTNATLGTPAAHTLTIAAQLPAVSFATATQSVTETVGTATILVQLSQPSTQTVTVPFTAGGTATSGSDYILTTLSPLSFTPGSVTQSITLFVVDEPTSEPNETVVVTLGTPTSATLGSPSSHTMTIMDNQFHPPVLSNLSFVLIAAASSSCDVFGGPLGAEYDYQFSYSDPGGDVLPPGATDSLAYLFHPSEIADGLVRSSSTYTGTGSSGTISNSICFLFETDTDVDVSMFVTDIAGNRSAPVSTNLPRPPGANIAAGPRPLSASGPSPAVRAGPR